MARIERLIKEGGWIIFGQIIAVGGSIVLVRILTEYIDSKQYGQIALGLTIAGMVNQVVMGGIIVGIGRYYAIAAEKNDLQSYFFASRNLLAGASAVVISIGLIIFVGLFIFNYSNWLWLAASSLVFSVLGSYNAAISGIQNAARQRAVVAFHSGLDAWLKILITVSIFIWIDVSSTAVILGYASASLITTISQLVFMHRGNTRLKINEKISTKWTQKIWNYSIPFSTWGLFTWLHQVSDKWALQVFTNTNDVGRYAVLYQLGFTPIALIMGMAVSFLGPILYQRSGDATDEKRNAKVHELSWRITHFSLLVCMVMFILAYFLHELLFNIIVTSEYRGVSYLLPWVVLSGGMFSSAQILALKLMSDMKPVALTSLKVVTSLIGTLLNIVGAFLAGLEGLIVSMVVFSLVYLVWMCVLAKQPESP